MWYIWISDTRRGKVIFSSIARAEFAVYNAEIVNGDTVRKIILMLTEDYYDMVWFEDYLGTRPLTAYDFYIDCVYRPKGEE